MDVAGEIRHVRERLKQSDEWEGVSQRLAEVLKDKTERISHKDLTDLTPKDKTLLVRKIALSVTKTSEYSILHDKAAEIIRESHPQAAAGTGASKASEALASMCSNLLQGRPELRHNLKSAINLPLPNSLRHSVWSAFLRESSVEKDIRLAFHDWLGESQAVVLQCNDALSSNPVLSHLQSVPLFSRAMGVLLTLWRRTTYKSISSPIAKNSVLLSIPFVYVIKEQLIVPDLSASHRTNRSRTLNKEQVSSVTVMFSYFMEMLPLTMKSGLITKDKAADEALMAFANQVEDILSSTDQGFVRRLQTILCISENVKGAKKKSTAGQSFQRQFASIIHPFLQRLFVGDLQMDVLCFVWDQCFIGLEAPNYQYTPYFVATWLLAMRLKISDCHSYQSVEKMLKQQSSKITVGQLQQEISDRFLTKLTRILAVEPLYNKPHLDDSSIQNSSHPLHVPFRITDVAADTSWHSATYSNIRQMHSQPVERKRADIAEETKKLKKEPVNAATKRHDYGAEEMLKKQMMELQQQQAKMMEIVMKKLNKLEEQDKPVITREDTRNLSSSPNSVHSLPVVSEYSAGSARNTVRRKDTLVSQLAPPLSRPVAPRKSSTVTYHQQPERDDLVVRSSSSYLQEKEVKEEEEEEESQFDPNNFTSADAQEVWLRIFQRFRDAMYLICHGSGEEKQELLYASQALDSTDTLS